MQGVQYFFESKKESFFHGEGKILSHIISKDGMHINTSRVEAIQQIGFLGNKKEIQAFNGKMNFLRRFIPNLVEHLRELTNMLKKDNTMKWTEDAVKSFNLVKFALTTTPVLISPNLMREHQDHEKGGVIILVFCYFNKVDYVNILDMREIG